MKSLRKNILANSYTKHLNHLRNIFSSKNIKKLAQYNITYYNCLVLLLFSIGEGRIKVSTLDGSPDDGLTIRAALKALAAKSVGGSFRWAVNTSLSGDLQVQVTKSFSLPKNTHLK